MSALLGDNMTDIAVHQPKSWWKRRNWWKIGFFIALFSFEVAREIVVIQSDAEAQPNVNFRLFRYQDYTAAAGIWKRTDKDEKMTPTVIKIECEQSKGTCTMVDTHMSELYVFEPNVSSFEARFSPDSITFDDNNAKCATLKFNIDLRLKKVNAMREQKPDTVKDEMCSKMEKRLDLTLADSSHSSLDMEKHFVPVLSALKAILQIF